MKTIAIDEDKLPAILERIPGETPIVMLNLLKFVESANYPDGKHREACSGSAAYYERYLAHAKNKIHEIGGTVLYNGTVCAEIIGEDFEYWDALVLVEYPSIGHLMNMIATPEYQDLLVHRAAGLEDSRLVATLKRS